jgi:hypothetical protein
MRRIVLSFLAVFGLVLQAFQGAIANPIFTVSALTVNPVTVSIANGPANVSATISVVSTNPINQTRLPDPIFYQSGDVQGTRLGGKLSLISGTTTNGTYQVTVTIPATTLTGGWTVIISAFTDTSGFSSTNGGYIGNFRVNGGSSNPTFTVSAITVNPATVSIANGPATLTATISIISTNPINQTRLPDPYFYQSGDIQGTRLSGKLALISGTTTNGTYQVTVTIPSTTLTGSWIAGLTAFTDTFGFSSTNGGYMSNFRVLNGPDTTITGKTPATKKLITITCVKGKLTKKVTAAKPNCPSGYKKK